MNCRINARIYHTNVKTLERQMTDITLVHNTPYIKNCAANDVLMINKVLHHFIKDGGFSDTDIIYQIDIYNIETVKDGEQE